MPIPLQLANTIKGERSPGITHLTRLLWGLIACECGTVGPANPTPLISTTWLTSNNLHPDWQEALKGVQKTQALQIFPGQLKNNRLQFIFITMFWYKSWFVKAWHATSTHAQPCTLCSIMLCMWCLRSWNFLWHFFYANANVDININVQNKTKIIIIVFPVISVSASANFT